MSLTSYSIEHTVNIGWLGFGLGWRFPVEDTDDGFKARLFDLCATGLFNQTRGHHRCELLGCLLKNTGRHSGAMIIQRGDETAILGSAEIRVIGMDKIYAAPTLIYHYIVDHHYRPPQEFIDAVIQCPSPGTREFWERYAKLETRLRFP